MRRFDAIIFDFDGTLATLTIDFALMRRKVLALAEALLPEDAFPLDPTFDALPVLELLERLTILAPSGEDALELASRARLAITAQELDSAREGQLFAFTRPMLSRLVELRLATGVITRNCTAAVKTVFPDVERACGVLLAREDVPRVKPDPAHLLAALARLGATPERTLMVGDHPMDIETARRAGCSAAAVASGHTAAETLAAHSPDFLAADCEELMQTLGLC